MSRQRRFMMPGWAVSLSNACQIAAEEGPPAMRIGEIAALASVRPPTIRYYEAMGLLTPKRSANGYRFYTAADLEQLRFILRARALGFTLEMIKEILQFCNQGESPCVYVLTQIEEKMAEIDSRIAALSQLKAELQQVQAMAERLSLGDHQNSTSSICCLLENQSQF